MSGIERFLKKMFSQIEEGFSSRYSKFQLRLTHSRCEGVLLIYRGGTLVA